MSKKKKYCPVCGAELDIDTIICTTCGERILGDAQTQEIEELQNTVEINSEEFEKHTKSTFWNKIEKYVYIIGVIVLALKICVFHATHEVNTSNIMLPDFNFITSAKCGSKDVKGLVKQLFEDGILYKTIEPTTISNLDVRYAVPVSYDEKIKRYTCNAAITMKSNQGGFIPAYGNINESNFFNSYLAQITELDFYNSRILLKSYDTMNLNVKYSSQISDNQLVVYLENTPIGNSFSCEDESKCQDSAISLTEFANILGFMPYGENENYSYDYEYDY